MNKEQRSQAVRTLTEAKALLVEVGWTKGQSYKETISPRGKVIREGYCAWGAINKADGPGEHAAKVFLLKAIKPRIKSKTDQRSVYDEVSIASGVADGIWIYNDRKRTTKQDILDVFDEAIELAKQ